MKPTDLIQDKINKLPKGYVFTYRDFINEVDLGFEAIVKYLNRLTEVNRISKLSKGKYYKPESTPFGNLEPNQFQVVKDLLEDDGKTIGYLTGYSIYNQLGLTTQVSNTIQIGRNEIRPVLQRDRYTIKFIKQKNTITKENIPLLQLLDAIRYIKKIPDTTTASACLRFLSLLKNLNEKETNTLVRLSQKYPPATRALLGALLEEIGIMQFQEVLQKSLNPITKYKLSDVTAVLKASEKWNLL